MEMHELLPDKCMHKDGEGGMENLCVAPTGTNCWMSECGGCVLQATQV